MPTLEALGERFLLGDGSETFNETTDVSAVIDGVEYFDLRDKHLGTLVAGDAVLISGYVLDAGMDLQGRAPSDNGYPFDRRHAG